MFPVELTNEMFNLVKGHSSLAKLAASEPVPFNGKEVFTFSLDSEIDIVAENGAKSNGGATVAPVSIVPIKVEYGTRVSDEFMYASDEDRLPILRTFAEGFSRKLARGIDIMAMHGVNPRTGSASDLIGNNCFDKKVTQKVTFNSSTPDANIEDAIALVNGNEEEVTGMAYAPAMKAALAAEVTTGGAKKYPELAWGGNPDTINGLAVDANATVSANSNADRAIVGDFRQYFKWGFAKEIPVQVIEYGNPDNSDAGDLKGHNQVYLRAEAYIGWGIIKADAFARVATSASV
jgi:hypothetical protein